MIRSDVVALVATELAPLLALAQMQGTDTTGNLMEPVDRALYAMGATTPSDPIISWPALLYEAQVSYEVLRTIWRRLGDQINLSSEGDSYQLNQAFANVSALLEEAAARVVSLGGSLAGPDARPGMMDLGFTATIDNGGWA
ncbi:MAG: hypothetical protein JSR79_05055 [Proteobacteria bacterium]|nr:hypothetical protein [Pseudomonadota bacterium]